MHSRHLQGLLVAIDDVVNGRQPFLGLIVAQVLLVLEVAQLFQEHADLFFVEGDREGLAVQLIDLGNQGGELPFGRHAAKRHAAAATLPKIAPSAGVRGLGQGVLRCLGTGLVWTKTIAKRGHAHGPGTCPQHQANDPCGHDDRHTTPRFSD